MRQMERFRESQTPARELAPPRVRNARSFALLIGLAAPLSGVATVQAQNAAPFRRATPPSSRDAAADSATVARTAFRAAQQATSQWVRDSLLRAATDAWPTQPAYWLARARAAALDNRASEFVAASHALVAMHQAAAVWQDTLLHRWANDNLDRADVDALQEASLPVVRGRALASIDSSVLVEGLAASARSGQLFVTSIRGRTVLSLTANGDWRDLGVSRDARVAAVLSTRVALDDRSLWVTSAPHPLVPRPLGAPSAPGAALLRVRIADGAVVEWHPLPNPYDSHLPGDMLPLPGGDVLVSDSETGQLYWWHHRAQRWSALRHPGFRSLQGLTLLPGGEKVLLADYSHGLYVLTLATRRIQRVTDAPGRSVLGLDGIAWHGGRVYAVQNGGTVPQILAITLNATFTAVIDVAVADRQPSLAPAPTSIAATASGVVYVGNSRWESPVPSAGGLPSASAENSVLVYVSTAPEVERGRRSVATTPAPPVGAASLAVSAGIGPSCSRKEARSP